MWYVLRIENGPPEAGKTQITDLDVAREIEKNVFGLCKVQGPPRKLLDELS